MIHLLLCDPDGYPTSILPAEVLVLREDTADVIILDVVPRTVPTQDCYLTRGAAIKALDSRKAAWTTEACQVLASSVERAVHA